MNSSPTSARSLRLVVGAGLLGLVGVVAGCNSDYITYSAEYRAKGINYFQQGDYADAASAFRNAIHQVPPDYTSHYYLGASLENMQNYQQAIEQYQACLQIMDVSMEGKSDDVVRYEAIDGLARSVAKCNDPTAEMAQINSLPKTALNDFLIAKIDRNSGDADSAIVAYRAALDLDPRNFVIAKEFGLYLQQLGQVDLARAVLCRANGLNQQDQDVVVALRDVGGVPGPANKDEADLAKPIIPQGPIPRIDPTKIHLQNPFTASDEQGPSSGNTGSNTSAGSASDANSTTPKD